MVKVIFFLFLFSLQGWALENKPLRSIPVKQVFESAVAGPHHLSLCGGLLWTFSEGKQQLIGIDPHKGTIVKNFSLPATEVKTATADITALTCQQDRLIILLNRPDEGSILEIDLEAGGKIKSKYKFPRKTRATDLFCNLHLCWILQDRPLITYNFKKWYEVWAPFPPELKKVYGRPDLDPFEDWQAKLTLAKNRYTKGAIDGFNQFVLLDTFHAVAVIRSGAEFVKWGSFGAWEGSFLSPKSITFVAENTLAVADSKLKAIFIFRRDGTYLGILSLGEDKIFAPDYPLGLATQGNRLFVADFRRNQVIAVDIKQFKSELENVASLTIRQNLFRRPEVLKDAASSLCLNCHDGLVSNFLFKFANTEFHHPLECSQCHDPHHVTKTKGYLRKQTPALCIGCHSDYSISKTNHVWNDKNKKGGSCTDCHTSHSDNAKILNFPQPQLCLNCHQDKQINHKSVEDMITLPQAKKMNFHEGKISCNTCHQTHINWQESKFIRGPTEIIPFCASCHGNKSSNLFQDFHKRLKAKGVSK